MSMHTKQYRCQCLEPAVQRILLKDKVSYRCAKHAVTEIDAKRNDWKLFDVKAERKSDGT